MKIPAIRQLMDKRGLEARAQELGVTLAELWRRMGDGRHADWRPLRGLAKVR